MDDLTDLLSKPRVYFAKKSTPDGSRIKVPEISIEKNLENSGLRDKNPDILSLPVQDQDEELRRSETDTQVIIFFMFFTSDGLFTIFLARYSYFPPFGK